MTKARPASPSSRALADRLRPVLLAPLARAAARGAVARGHRRPGLAADPDQEAPRDQRLRARRARAHVGAWNVGPHRAPRDGRADRADPRRRPPAHRPDRDRGGRGDPRERQAPPHRVARRPPEGTDRATNARRSRPHCRHSRSCWRRRPVDAPQARVCPDLRLPQAPPQLPTLLLRPAHVRRRNVDAEHRTRVARRLARTALARARRRAR